MKIETIILLDFRSLTYRAITDYWALFIFVSLFAGFIV